MKRDVWHVRDEKGVVPAPEPCLGRARAFTLIELLVVISIMGLIAALAVPALKNLGKSNIQTSASRQMLDAVGRARQLAISQHTTVYMVFLPMNFWLPPYANSATWNTTLTPAELTALTNVIDKQLTGYNFVSFGKVGDQPGQHVWHYLDDWQALPEGTFIAQKKFSTLTDIPTWHDNTYKGLIDDYWWYPGGMAQKQIYPFVTNAIPFPTEQSAQILLPCIAFNHLGQLISETVDANGIYLGHQISPPPDGARFHHAYIPLAQGAVGYARDGNKQPTLAAMQLSDIIETPATNSTSISFNVIDVDPLSGRAKLQVYHMQ